MEEVFRKLRPVMGPEADRLWRIYITSDRDVRRTIEQSLRLRLARELGRSFESRDILLEPPPEELARGQYALGTVYYGRRSVGTFGLREHELIQHTSIFGRSGSGKTNIAYLLLMQFITAGKPFIACDWKRNYRDLLLLPEARDIQTYTVARDVSPFYFNPLIPPPGTRPDVWAEKLIEVLQHAFFLGEGVAYILRRALDASYVECRRQDGPESFPTLQDVKRWLEEHKSKGRQTGWLDSAVRAIATLCMGEVGRAFNSRSPMDLTEVLKKQVVLELDALTTACKTFLPEALLLWIHHYRLAKGKREQFSHALILEEAHHLLLRKKQETSGKESVTDILLREIRELGEAIILLDQRPSLISKPALGNSYCTIAMDLKHRSDLSMLADSLLLNSEQTDHLGNLEVGYGVVRLQGRWTKPFLVKFGHIPVKKGNVTDEAISRRMRASESSSGVLPALAEFFERIERTGREIPTPGREDKGGIAELEEQVLRDIQKHPSSGMVERQHRLSLSARSLQALSSRLSSLGLVSFECVSLGRGRVKIAALTSEGREALGLSPGQPNRLGGASREYWKRRIAQELREDGYEVELEAPIGGGQAVDILAHRDGSELAIEVETGASDALRNVRKCLTATNGPVAVVVTDKAKEAAIREQIRDLATARLEVYFAPEFLSLLGAGAGLEGASMTRPASRRKSNGRPNPKGR